MSDPDSAATSAPACGGDYDRLRRTVRDERMPCALVDLDALERNFDRCLEAIRRRGKTLRIATKSVRAPTAILENGRWLLWYAGDNFDQDAKPKDMLGAIRSGRIRMGIGFARQAERPPAAR